MRYVLCVSEILALLQRETLAMHYVCRRSCDEEVRFVLQHYGSCIENIFNFKFFWSKNCSYSRSSEHSRESVVGALERGLTVGRRSTRQQQDHLSDSRG